MVELAVNIAFILAEGDQAADQALRHAHQKSLRDLSRRSEVGGQTIQLEWSGVDGLDIPEELQAAVEEYTTRSGGERTQWTQENINARIARVGEKLSEPAMTSLHWARFAVYRHSSEILHGTLFGVMFFMGQTAPGKTAPKGPSEWLAKIAEMHLMILLATSLAIRGVAEALEAALGLPQVGDHARSAFLPMTRVPSFQTRKAPSGTQTEPE